MLSLGIRSLQDFNLIEMFECDGRNWEKEWQLEMCTDYRIGVYSGKDEIFQVEGYQQTYSIGSSAGQNNDGLCARGKGDWLRNYARKTRQDDSREGERLYRPKWSESVEKTKQGKKMW